MTKQSTEDALDQANYVSIIGFNYLQPILTLVEGLNRCNVGSPNEVQCSPIENGFSVSIIVLTIHMLESLIVRAKYDLGPAAHTARNALEFFRQQFPKCIHTPQLTELYVVRDAIVHNHVWEAKFDCGAYGGMSLGWARPMKGYGDPKWSAVIDLNSRKTKLLGLNLFPTRICRSDAVIVLKEATAVAEYLEQNGSKLVNISNQWAWLNGRMDRVVDIISALQP